MDLSFLPLTLQAVDKVTAEALCLFVGEDERPLTGLAGLADWRLAGGLSRLLRAGLLKGTEGEALLTPARRMPFGKLFLFGMGALSQSDEQLAARVSEAIRKLASAGVEETALQLPRRLSPELGIRTLVDVVAPSKAIVFGADPAALVRALSQVANHGTAQPPERRVVKVPGPPPRPTAPHRPGPAERPAAAQRSAPLAIPKPAPLPFTPSNAHVIRQRPLEPESAPLTASLSGALAAGAGTAPSDPQAAAVPPAAAAVPPTAAAVPPVAAAGSAPGPGEARQAPPRAPLPKTQRYVPPEPRPGKKKL